MKIARLCVLAIALAVVAAPLTETAFAIWPFTSSTPTTTTKKKMPKISSKTAAKQEPGLMQKMWNGVTSPFSTKKETPKKPSKPIGFSALVKCDAQRIA